MTKNLNLRLELEKNCYFFIKLQIIYTLASRKDVQDTKEAFSSQKRTSSTSKHEISDFFSLLLWVIFAVLRIRNFYFGSGIGSGSGL
jgi:hypothetical protein